MGGWQASAGAPLAASLVSRLQCVLEVAGLFPHVARQTGMTFRVVASQTALVFGAVARHVARQTALVFSAVARPVKGETALIFGAVVFWRWQVFSLTW